MKGETIKGLYSIEGFSSSGVGDGSPGGHGFAIVLAAPVATAFLQMKRSDGGHFVEGLRDLINRTFPTRNGAYHAPPEFFRDTWLLVGLKVPGNCACFGIEGDAFGSLQRAFDERGPVGRDLRYSPHNLDNLRQSACLLSVWLYWFNIIIAGTDFDLPHSL